ncbi:MAG: glutamine amidotransferase family protein [Pseudomonadota bacterium]
MCGIVGLFAKTEKPQAHLGLHLSQMLDSMADRGPDSAGVALYTDEKVDTLKITVQLDGPSSIDTLDDVNAVHYRGDHGVLHVPLSKYDQVISSLARLNLRVVGTGHRMELFKGVGHPRDVAESFELASMVGTHGLGHTRMATESAVTIDGAHPFSTGLDLCLVHNGSLSNHASLRRRLAREGVHVKTENDSEVAAAYITWRLGQGLTLREALSRALDDLDGFFTFVVGTEAGFGVLRDPISCKPAVMAETDDLIAFASEYRALAGLPGIEQAKVWEPEPAQVYFWERAA